MASSRSLRSSRLARGSDGGADQNPAEARQVAPTMTFSTAVRPPYRPTPCRVLATPRPASRCGLISGRRPPNSTSPASGRMKPHRTFSSVVLPAPFGPMTPSTCRGGTASNGVERGQPAETDRHALHLKY